MMKKTVLYIHGMGGGGDSRIPSILKDHLGPRGIDVIVRTYDFDPEIASRQIESWREELCPDLVIGESLGSVQAIRVKGLPHLFVSPSLGAPSILSGLSFLSLIPGMRRLFNRIYRPKPGDRQSIDFRYGILRKYGPHGKAALSNSPRNGSKDEFYAFFGTKDHYRKYGVVSIHMWKKYFGDDSFETYPGTHFMEEEFVKSLLIPKIIAKLQS